MQRQIIKAGRLSPCLYNYCRYHKRIAYSLVRIVPEIAIFVLGP